MRLALNGEDVATENLADRLHERSVEDRCDELVLDLFVPLETDPRDTIIVRVTRTSPKEAIEAAQDCLDELG